ncbi:hypothetical protein OF001_U10445 [Pseudomonas sp. OF001]|nr:hypothetical protein OF001_U10445 [Pseudomonas sp. OF001]
MGDVQQDLLAGQAHSHRQLGRGTQSPEPAGLDRQGGRRQLGALGRRGPALSRLRVPHAQRERRHPGRQPARLAARLCRNGALVRQGRAAHGGDRAEHRHAVPPMAQLVQGAGHRRPAHRLQGSPVRADGDQHPSLRRSPWLHADRLLHAGLPYRRQVVDPVYRHPARRGHRQLRGAPAVHGAAHRARRPRPGECGGLRRRRGPPAAAEGAGGVRGRQLHRVAAAVAQLRVVDLQGRPGQLLRPGRAQLHVPHHRRHLRCAAQAGAHVPRHHLRRDHLRRVLQQARARLRRRLPAGNPLPRPAVHVGLPRPDPAGLGPHLRLAHGALRPHVRRVAVRRGPAGGEQPHHPARQREGPVRPAGAGGAQGRPPVRQRHARPRRRADPQVLRGGRRHRGDPPAVLPGQPQHGHQPDERQGRRWRGQQVGTEPRHPQPVRLRRQPVHHQRRTEPDPDHSRPGPAPGRPHRQAVQPARPLNPETEPIT